MGAQKSVHAGKAKIDFNVDFTHKLCAALMLHPFRSSGSPLSLVIGSLCIKHPNLFGKSEKLDVLWDKGLYDSNVLIAYRKPRPEWLAQQSFVIQHSINPEIGVHGQPVDNFSRSGSGGVNLCRFSAGLDLSEPASSNWSSKTSLKFEHVRPINDDGRPISRDLDGFPVTCSGGYHDSMVIVKQESRFAKADDSSFTRFNLQIEQGIPLLSMWLTFNRFKFVASKGVKLGPAFLLTSLTGGSIVGDIAPYQAFSIGGIGSVRGYGEGAVGTGRSCLVANSELTHPLRCCLGAVADWCAIKPSQVQKNLGLKGYFLNLQFQYGGKLSDHREVMEGVQNVIQRLEPNIDKQIQAINQNQMFEGAVFLDCGTDFGSGRHVPGNPALRHGKPGTGIGVGYGLRYKSPLGHFQVDYAINAFQQRTLYFGFSNLSS